MSASNVTGILALLGVDEPDYSNIESQLVALGTEAVPELITYLTDSDPKIRSSVATALGQLGDSRAVPGLIEEARIRPDRDFKDDWNEQALAAVASALGKLGDSRAVPALLDLADYCVAIRSGVMADSVFPALVKIGDPVALDRLLPLCFQADGSMASETLMCTANLASAQGKAMSRNAVSTLLGVIDLAVQGENIDLAVRAVWLAAFLSDRKEAHRLAPILASPAKAVRQMAETQLGGKLRGIVYSGARSELPPLDGLLRYAANGYPHLLGDVIDAYGLRADQEALDCIAPFVSHSDKSVRDRAIKAVASIEEALRNEKHSTRP